MLRFREGARSTALQLTWARGDGTAEDLTGRTLTGRMKLHDSMVRAITGDLEVVTAVGGVFTWAPSVEDVATPGVWLVEFRASDTLDSSLYDLSYSALLTVETAI